MLSASAQPQTTLNASASAAQSATASPASPMQLSANIPVIRDNGKGKTDDVSPAWLITVLALLLAFAYVIIKFKSGAFNLRGQLSGLDKKSGNSELKIKKQIMLTAKTSIHLLSWNGDELLIACSDNQVTVLDKKKMDLSAVSDVEASAQNLPQQNERT
jgi:flagellar biogenesis protein FliO